MQRYVVQLLADLEMAARHAPTVGAYAMRPPFFEEDEDHLEPRYQVTMLRLCDLFGLTAGVFPPQERLTKSQVTKLLTSIEALWRSWGINWTCPRQLSARRRYTVMTEHMQNELVGYHPDYGADVDFCARHAEHICPFGENGECRCRQADEDARRFVEDWESEHYEETLPGTLSPSQEFQNWLTKDEPCELDWDYDQERAHWRRFAADEEQLAWLYFYRPDFNAELRGEDPEPAPDDFDDFDWDHDPDFREGIDLPF